VITDSDIAPAYLSEEEMLSREIGIAITHIAKHNSFDKQELIKLLKRARKYIDDDQQSEVFIRRQVG